MKRPDAKYMNDCKLWYEWYHFSTEKQGKTHITFPFPRTIAIRMLDELIVKWNRSNPDHWRYRRITRY